MLYRPDVDNSLCFVLMPFKDYFNEYYEHIIKAAISDAGLQPLRADEVYQPSSVIQQIWSQIWRARIVVADVTDRNPNVVYELGLCHALNVPVVIITQNIGDTPFDIQHIRLIHYDTKTSRWGDKLREDLKKAIVATLNMRDQPADLPWPAAAALGVESGVDIRNTRYGFSKIMDDDCRQITMTGTNFGDVLGARGKPHSVLYESIIRLLSQNQHTSVDLLFAPPRLLWSETALGYNDLVEISIPQLWDLSHDKRLSEDQRSRLTIRAHRGAFGLAAFVRDQDDPQRALIVITPRWISDATGRARMFAAIWQKESPNEFRTLWGEMESSLRLESEGSLAEVVAHLSGPDQLGANYEDFIRSGRAGWRLPPDKDPRVQRRK